MDAHRLITAPLRRISHLFARLSGAWAEEEARDAARSKAALQRGVEELTRALLLAKAARRSQEQGDSEPEWVLDWLVKVEGDFYEAIEEMDEEYGRLDRAEHKGARRDR